MHICLISPFPSDVNKVVGGVEAVTSALAPALSHLQGITKISIIGFHSTIRNVTQKLDNKVTVYYLRKQKSLNLLTNGVLNYLQAKSLVHQLKPDLIHGEGIDFMGEFSTSLSHSSVVTIHGLVHIEARKMLKDNIMNRNRVILIDRMVNRVLSNSKTIISTSHYDSQTFIPKFEQKIVSINNPIDQKFFFNRTKENPIKYFLFAGLMHPRKNIEGILTSFKNLTQMYPSIRLVIAGPKQDKIYEYRINSMIEKLGIMNNISLVGHVDKDNLIDLIKECICVIQFSWEETSPTIIAQAMALSKPVIASNVGGISEMVSNSDTGFLVNPGDNLELTNTMAKIVSNQEMRMDMGKSAHNFAKVHFYPSIVAEQTFEVYSRLVQ